MQISTYKASVLSILWVTFGLLGLLPTLFWPAVEIQDGGVFGYVNCVSYHVGNKNENLLESNILWQKSKC